MENWNQFFNVNCNLVFNHCLKIAIIDTIYAVTDCPKYYTS